MTKITNNTNSPYEILTLQGKKLLVAHGSLEAEFDPSYLALLDASGAVEVEDAAKRRGRPRKEQ